MDTILWTEDKRAYEKLGDDIYEIESEWAHDFKRIILKFIQKPERICDIVCAYGAVLHALNGVFPTTHFVGIDPGIESIEICRESCPPPTTLYLR